MKKLLTLTLITLLALSLFGCEAQIPSTTEQSQPAAQTQPVVETEAETVIQTEAETVAETKQEDEKIGEEKAKKIALDHAGLKEPEVKHLFVELDYDDGVLRYEVDFHKDQYEYDYDIDAKTGKILSYDKDIDD